jgi:regulator of protease activity HflC (stomatin/prohibitin superfamily)
VYLNPNPPSACLKIGVVGWGKMRCEMMDWLKKIWKALSYGQIDTEPEEEASNSHEETSGGLDQFRSEDDEEHHRTSEPATSSPDNGPAGDIPLSQGGNGSSGGGNGNGGSGSGDGNGEKPSKWTKFFRGEGYGKFWWLVGLYVGLSFVLVLVSFLFREDTDTSYFSLWQTTLVLIIAHFACSFRTSSKDEQPIVEILGYPLYVVGPGPHFVPFGIAKLDRFPKTAIQEEIPADLEKVHFGPPPIPEGKVEPLRVTAGGAGKDTTDSLNRPMTLEPNLIYRIEIKDPIAFKGAIGSVANAIKQLSDTIVTAIQGAYASRTPRQIFDDWGEINAELEQRLEERTGDRCPVCHDGTHTKRIPDKKLGIRNVCEKDEKHTVRPWWGVNVLEAALKTPGLPHQLNISLRETAQSGEKARQVKIAAPAEEARLKAEGRGRGDAIRSEGVGEAAVLEAKKRALGIGDGREYLTLEAQVALAENANTTLFHGGDDSGLGMIGNLSKLATAKTNNDLKKGSGGNAD